MPYHKGNSLMIYYSKDPLPVLVYIHGGFLHFGSGHTDMFPSAQLAAELNSVIVSFNYRLNVFGWLAVEVGRLFYNLYMFVVNVTVTAVV